MLVIAALLAGLGYWAFHFIADRMLEAKVTAALPKVAADIRRQREALVKAIEAYKAHSGVYPPDHVVSRQPLVVDAITNTLLYELAGTVLDTTNHVLVVRQLEAADARYVQEFFQVTGFRNCAPPADQVMHFLPTEDLPVKQLHDDPDVFVLTANLPLEDYELEVVWSISAGSWRYVSSAPTNNPGRFDLWLEVTGRGHKVPIGNWKAVE